jgi:hypothetical protein
LRSFQKQLIKLRPTLQDLAQLEGLLWAHQVLLAAEGSGTAAGFLFVKC